MIKSKEQLQFFLKADMIANRGRESFNVCERFKLLLFPDYIIEFLRALRYEEYYHNLNKKGLCRAINLLRLQRLGVKLGFSIPINVFGYGLVIPHYGTIVVGAGNKIGNYAVLHTSTCITAGAKHIGDALYLSTGAKVLNDISLGDGVSISANSVVNKSVSMSNVLLVGCPAIVKKDSVPWYIRDGEEYEKRVSWVKTLKAQIGFQEDI